MLDVDETTELLRDNGNSKQINNNCFQMPSNLCDEIQKIKLLEETNYDKKCNENVQDCFNSNEKEILLTIHENNDKLMDEIKGNLIVKTLDIVSTKTTQPLHDDVSVKTDCNSNSEEKSNGNVQDCFNFSKKKELLMTHENNNSRLVESIIKENEELKSSNVNLNDISLKSKENNFKVIESSCQDLIDQINNDSKSSNDLFDENDEIGEASYLQLTSEYLTHPFVLDRNQETVLSSEEIVINMKKERNNLETVSSQEKAYDNHNMNTEQAIEEELIVSDDDSSRSRSDVSYSSDNSESEEDVIEGTPSSSNNSVSSENEDKIVVTYSNVNTEEELDVLRELIHVFDIHAHAEWSDKITHLVVKTAGDNDYCLRTTKYMSAILANCYIVTFDWAKDSLSSKTLLPEDGYIPLDASGEQSPLISWRVGRGIIESPMQWTKDCILYFHSSVRSSGTYPSVKIWAKKANFNITECIEELNNEEFKIRIILAFTPEEDVPSDLEIKTWMMKYKAVTLYIEWFFECLFRYRFIEIDASYQVLKIDPTGLNLMDIDISMFQFT